MSTPDHPRRRRPSRFARGGTLPPIRPGADPDAVHAVLSPGRCWVPPQVRERYGDDYLRALNAAPRGRRRRWAGYRWWYALVQGVQVTAWVLAFTGVGVALAGAAWWLLT